MTLRSPLLGISVARSIAVLCIVVLATTAHTAQAGINVWTNHGPYGADVRALVIDPATPSTLYAGTSVGFFRSTDGGGSWRPSDVPGLPVFDPVMPTTAYAATGGGVFKSTDGGSTWNAANVGLPPSVDTVFIDPSTPRTLYATVGGYGGVFKSMDAGATWAAAGLAATAVFALAIDPVTPGTLYAAGQRFESGTLRRAVYKSTDGGNQWTAENAGLPSDVSILFLVVDPITPSTLYATSLYGAFKTMDGGATWERLGGARGLFPQALAIDPLTPSTLYAGTSTGVFKSTDTGANWNALNAGLTDTDVRALAVDPLMPGTLYVGTSRDGVFKSTDGGTTWSAANAGLSGIHATALAIDPITPDTVYAVTHVGGSSSGLFKSTDHGRTWNAAGLAGLFSTSGALAIDPIVPSTLYASTGYDVFKSTNGGATWNATNADLRSGGFALALDPSMPTTLYAGTCLDFNPFGSGCHSYGLLRTTDRGGTWQKVPGGFTSPVTPLAVDPITPSTLYAAVAGYAGGLFKSTDAGETWEATGLSAVDALAIDPVTPGRVYAAGQRVTFGIAQHAVFKSVDGGRTWRAIGPTATAVHALAIDPVTPSTLYAVGQVGQECDLSPCYHDVVFKSRNAGATWSAFDSGPTSAYVFALVVDPLMPSRLYAGSNGVYSIQQAPCVGDCPTETPASTHTPAATPTRPPTLTATPRRPPTPTATPTQPSTPTATLIVQPTCGGDCAQTATPTPTPLTASPTASPTAPLGMFTKITTGDIVTTPAWYWNGAWGDYDDDGYLDLFVGASFPSKQNYLYHNNRDATFTLIDDAAMPKNPSNQHGAAWADYDNDGHLDLIVTAGNPEVTHNVLYHNNGDATFSAVTDGPIYTQTYSNGFHAPSWGDYDDDGFLDLFIAGHDTVNRLFHNNGDGSFTRILGSAGGAGVLVNDPGASEGRSWVDYDNDGDLDLFVSNNAPAKSFLYRNEGSGQFTKVAGSGLTDRIEDSLAVCWADYDNDGFLDLFLANAQVNSLYHNNQDGTFTRISDSAAVSEMIPAGVVFPACAWGDYDNDGFIDLFVTTGCFPASPDCIPRHNLLYHNSGDGTFTRVTEGSVVNDSTTQCVGASWGDYDNDGFLDLFVSQGAFWTTPQTNLLYHNDGNDNAWLNVKLMGTVSNRSAIGAKVRVSAFYRGESRLQMREISGGDGDSNQTNALNAAFGLADATTIDTLRVEWPSGAVQEFRDVAPRQFLTITEPLCVGDCKDSGEVSIDDLLTLVNLALGDAQRSGCPHGVPNNSAVDVALIIQAVNSALNGCTGQ